jgi:hypothetical protein
MTQTDHYLGICPLPERPTVPATRGPWINPGNYWLQKIRRDWQR